MKDSWFSKTGLSISTTVQFTYCWSQRYPQYILEHELGISPTTLVDWNNFCQEVCSLIRAMAEDLGVKSKSPKVNLVKGRTTKEKK